MTRRQLVFAVPLLLWTAACHSSSELRVLSYNIRHGEGVDGALDLQRIAAVVNRAEPGLVALQEVDRMTGRTGGGDQALELGRLTQRHSAFGKLMDYDGGEYGLAILSKYPIERSWVILLPPGIHEPRSALAVQVNVPGSGPLTFVSLHFDWLASDSERFAQAEALLAALGSLDMPVILAGDFNDTPGSRTMARMGDAFTDVSKPPEESLTFPSSAPRTEIDFVMFRPARAFAAEARVLNEPVASDHRPVLARLWAR